jgi:predicted XRE-type DNA-binding protein
MPDIGRRCHELRITDGWGQGRIVYRTGRDAIVIADVLAKKARATPPTIAACKRRLREYSHLMGGDGAMDARKRAKLQAAGWKVGTAAELLELTPEEAELVEMRVALAGTLRDVRRRTGTSQAELARRIGSSQSRVSKLEAADASVSLDLLVWALVWLGATRAEIGAAIAGDETAAA